MKTLKERLTEDIDSLDILEPKKPIVGDVHTEYNREYSQFHITCDGCHQNFKLPKDPQEGNFESIASAYGQRHLSQLMYLCLACRMRYNVPMIIPKERWASVADAGQMSALSKERCVSFSDSPLPGEIMRESLKCVECLRNVATKVIFKDDSEGIYKDHPTSVYARLDEGYMCYDCAFDK